MNTTVDRCAGMYRAFVWDGGHIVYTARGKTAAEAHLIASIWIARQVDTPGRPPTAQRLKHTKPVHQR